MRNTHSTKAPLAGSYPSRFSTRGRGNPSDTFVFDQIALGRETDSARVATLHPVAQSAGPTVRVLGLALAALTVITPVGCTANVPSSVRASLQSADAKSGDHTLVVHLDADVGGGCNVQRTYSIDVDTEVSGTSQTITIGDHDYQSDGGPCADLASAETDVPLDPGFLTGDLETIRFDLGDQENTFRLSIVDDSLRIEELSASNVDLTCSETVGDLACSTSSR